MGYGPVHRYTGGKMDWAAAGWEREGRLDAAPFAGDVAARDVPTCRPDESLAEVRARVEAAGWDRAVVVGDGDIVLGLLSGERLDADAALSAELAMDPGPSTFRPSVPVRELADYMREHRLQNLLVTTADGVLVGALDRRRVEESADG
jgi:CBS domain-containing protein